MIRLHRAFLIFVWCAVAALAGEDDVKWNVVSKTPDLTISERPHDGSKLREFRAVALIAMPPEVVRRVLDDVEEFPRFVPYVTEARVIMRDAGSRVSYTRISPPLAGDRDYTIRVRFETRHLPGGATCYCNRWQAANELGPPEIRGVTRVKISEGSWLLEPTPDGRQTRATYTIFSDSGGSLPSYLINAAGRSAIPKLFDAIRKQARLPKYSAAK